MGRRSYYFEADDAHRIELSWKGYWRDINIDLDGVNIGKFDTKDLLIEPYDYKLVNGTCLSFQLIPRIKIYDMQVKCNRCQVIQLSSSPEELLSRSFFSIYLLVIIDFLMGILAILFPYQFPQKTPFIIVTLSFCFVNIVLGIFSLRRSTKALVANMGLLLLNLICLLVLYIHNEQRIIWEAIPILILVVINQLEIIKAIKVLKMKNYQCIAEIKAL